MSLHFYHNNADKKEIYLYMSPGCVYIDHLRKILKYPFTSICTFEKDEQYFS